MESLIIAAVFMAAANMFRYKHIEKAENHVGNVVAARAAKALAHAPHGGGGANGNTVAP